MIAANPQCNGGRMVADLTTTQRFLQYAIDAKGFVDFSYGVIGVDSAKHERLRFLLLPNLLGPVLRQIEEEKSQHQGGTIWWI